MQLLKISENKEKINVDLETINIILELKDCTLNRENEDFVLMQQSEYNRILEIRKKLENLLQLKIKP